MKYHLLTGLTLLLLSPHTKSADARFCDTYAKTAVKQQIANVSQSCAEKGSGWSPSYITHKAWCMGTQQAAADKAMKARNSALGSCGADTGKINWQILPDIPAVWDRLFAQMIQATQQDDVTAIQVMHRNGVDIQHKEGSNKSTILYHAIDAQAEKTANYLLTQKARLESSNGGNALAKMLEDKQINYRMLGTLLKKGLNPNTGGTSDDSFPLLLAAKKNDYTAAQMVLRAGANPNLKRAKTPLIYAVKNRNTSMIQLLLKAGANPNLSGHSSSCLPLDEALKSGSRGVIDLLKSKGAKTSANCR